MQKELIHLMEENKTLKSALQREGQECASLKVCSRDHALVAPLGASQIKNFLFLQKDKEQKVKENSQLVEELSQMKDENENLRSKLEQQLKEMEHLKVCGLIKCNPFQGGN